jgi:cytochrome c
MWRSVDRAAAVVALLAAAPAAADEPALGRPPTPAEIAAWDIDVRPDGAGLPDGSGTVAGGEEIYVERCAACHGDFGEGADRWPPLAGGRDSLTEDDPERTVGSYWPYLSTVFDYVRRAMPFGDARSLTDDEVYGLVAYLMFLNDLAPADFELSDENFAGLALPNEANFIDDDRLSEPHQRPWAEPCMRDCAPGDATVVMRAAVLDVTPDDGGDAGRGDGAE